jgi:hypothetical protein
MSPASEAPALCPACAEALPPDPGERCAACGERLGPSRYRDLPVLPLRRVDGAAAVTCVALAVFALALVPGVLSPHPGERTFALAALAISAVGSGAGGLVVARDLRRGRVEGGLPLVAGAAVGVGFGVVLVAAGFTAVAMVDLASRQPRSPPNETSAIGALKTIALAQALFREGDKENDGNLDYGSLAELGAGDVVDRALAGGTRSGYLFRAGYGVSTSEFLWFATAEPVEPGRTGSRYFAVNQDGVVFYTTSGPFRLNLGDCAMPPGAFQVGRLGPPPRGEEGQR